MYRVLCYLDDFAVAPARVGDVSTAENCQVATSMIENSLDSLGLTRHPSKGEWIGATRVVHLGIVIDSLQEKFYIAPRKIKKVRRIARHLIRECYIGRRCVSAERLRSFVGVFISISLSMPYARFNIRSLYWDLSKQGT